MRFLLVTHAALTLGGWLLITLFGPSPSASLWALSFAAGAGIAFFNLLVLVLVWPRILAKKLVALSIGVIVFKFAILAWIINAVATGDRLNLGWFAGGLALVVLSVLATAVKVSDELSDRPLDGPQIKGL